MARGCSFFSGSGLELEGFGFKFLLQEPCQGLLVWVYRVLSDIFFVSETPKSLN